MSGITIFYNEEFGYIIGSHTKQAKTDIPTTLDQVEILEPDTSIENLSKYMYKAIEKSFNNPIYNNEILPKYWTVSGIKSFSSFSKNFSSVKIIVDDGVCKCYKLIYIFKYDDKIEAVVWYSNGKFYESSKNPNDTVELLLPINPEVLGETVRNLALNSKDIDFEKDFKCGEFETADDSKISYKLLPDEYIDIEDGHTDAYQIYIHEEYENNYIGFMIDTAYESFSSEDIKRTWTRWYGDLKSFKYKEIDNKEYYVEIIGKNKKIEKHSYLFKDGEEVLELTFEIDLLNTPQDLQEKIKKDFTKFVKSVKVVKK